MLADTADIAAAASGVAWGIFYNAGQTCNAGSRVVVERSVREQLVDEIGKVAASQLQPGEPLDPRTKLGALVDQAQLDKVLGYVDIGRREGATLASAASAPARTAAATSSRRPCSRASTTACASRARRSSARC